MSKVVNMNGKFVPSAKNPSPHLIEMFEKFLTLAKDGEISGAIMAVSYSDGSATLGMAGAYDSYSSIGALEQAKWLVLKENSDAKFEGSIA